MQTIRAWRRLSLRDILADPRPWVRVLAIVALCLAIGIPVGAALGLLGPLYGSALLVALVVAYLMLRSLLFGLIALVGLIFVLPFAALPIDIGFTPTFLDVVLVAVFFVWAARVAAHKEREFRALSPIVGVLIFVLLAIFSFIAGLSHAPLTPNVIRHFGEILLSILTFVLVTNAIRTPAQLRLITTAIVIAAGISAIVGIVLYVLPEETTVRALSALRVVGYPSGSDVLRYIEDDPSRAMRATATSIDPNVLGGALIFGTTITVSQLFAQAPVLSKRWLGFLSLCMVTCLFLTYSRGSMVGLIAALALLALLRYRRLFWFMLLGAALAFILPPTQAYVQHFISGIQGEDLATQMRFGEYKDALILISRYPWFGVGFAGTPDIDTYLGVSNVYLLIAENMGVLGLAAFLGTLLAYVGKVIGALRSHTTRSQVSSTTLGFFFAIIGGMVGGLFDHYLFNLVFPHASTLLWLTIGLGAVSLHLDLSTPGSVDRPMEQPLLQVLMS